ncbi:MAG: type III PLP-dependent enzyme [Sneathiella sp.]
MVRQSQTDRVETSPAEAFVEGRVSPLGLRHYSAENKAVLSEDSNDAVHLLYPHILKRKADRFVQGFRGNSLYALKSNPHPAVLKVLWEQGIRKFEVASLREVEYALKLYPDADLYFMHPIKSRQAIRRAYALGVRNFAFDGLDELKKIEIETDHAQDLSLFLRIQVDQREAAHPLSDKFGASLQEAPLLLQRAKRSSCKLGLTFHVGSQCMDPLAYSVAIRDMSEMLKQTEIAIDMIDIGGGFPVPYPGMSPRDLSEYFEVIHAAIDECGLQDLVLFCEPGRALVAEAGAVAVRVELRKGKMLYLNDGTYGSLFDAGVSSWPYPLALMAADGSPKAGATTSFKFYGPTCDSLDVMEGPFELDSNLCEGDWIIFKHLGAYGYAMQTRFNGFYSETTVSVGKEVRTPK